MSDFLNLFDFLIYPHIMVYNLILAIFLSMYYVFHYHHFRIVSIILISFLIFYMSIYIFYEQVADQICQALWNRNLYIYLKKIRSEMAINNMNWSIPMGSPYNPCLEMHQYIPEFQNTIFYRLSQPEYQLGTAFILLMLNLTLLIFFCNDKKNYNNEHYHQILDEYFDIVNNIDTDIHGENIEDSNSKMNINNSLLRRSERLANKNNNISTNDCADSDNIDDDVIDDDIDDNIDDDNIDDDVFDDIDGSSSDDDNKHI